jgi:hypothetical protein
VAPLPTIPDTYRVTFNHFGTGFNTYNIIHWRSTTGTASQLAAAINTAATANNIFAFMHSNWTTPSVLIYKLDGTSAGQAFSVSGLNGTGTGDYVPAAAIIVSFHTAQRGSRGRGRTFIGPVAESVMQNGKILTADATAIATKWNDFMTAMASVPTPFVNVVASYKWADKHDVTSLRVDIPLGTQRRRQEALF